MATVKIENISKQFSKSVWGVKSMDLDIQDKEFIVFLGPSGCGKTTTMRLVAGLEEVTTGNIYLDENNITYAPPKNRDISMVFQSYAIWPHMTVFNNIAFPLKIKKIDSKSIEKQVNEVSELVKITDLLNRLPNQLSGGQRQRVALARALVVKPKLFLMDEPLSNLDAILRVAMRTELKSIHYETGATTIFVTHDQSEALSIADRIVIMQDGEVVQIGTPDEVYAHSANVFVAGFIGTPPTNFFDVEFQKQNGDASLKHPTFSLKLNQKNSTQLQNFNKKSLILGVRPEDILLTTPEKGNLSGTVVVVEPQGSHKIIAIKVGEQQLKIIASLEAHIKVGETVHMSFRENKLHLFDPDSKQRL